MDDTRLSLMQIDEPAEWDRFVANNDGHLLQSFEWGELKSHFGWSAERWASVEGGQLRAAAQVLYRKLAPGLTIAYVPRGPINPDADFVRSLTAVVRKKGVFLLKLEPDWLAGDGRDRILGPVGFSPLGDTIQPAETIRIDLKKELDPILASMKPKWRYNIRLAEKKGVRVRNGAASDLTAFYELTRVTAERDRFDVHSSVYYTTAFELLNARGAACLLVAEHESKTLAMIFLAAFGREAIYLYGASGNEHRNVMPNHALHWAAIKWAKERGCTRYDLWGIKGSLLQFKQGFGGETVQYTGAWDLVLNPLQYQAYKAARRLRRSALG